MTHEIQLLHLHLDLRRGGVPAPGHGAAPAALSILALLTLLTAGGSWLWSRRSLDGVVYERTLSATRVFRGESIVLTASVVNRKWLPLPWLEVEDQISDRVKVRERETLPSALRG